MNAAYIVDAVRTPIGKLGGALSGVRADDLLTIAVRRLLDRHDEVDPATIEEFYAGDTNGQGEDNRNVARMAALLAGLPPTVAGATVNRLCGSGMEAVIGASRTVAVGDADVVLAGGVESMTRAPWVLMKPAKGFPTSNEQLWNTALGWRMVNPAMPTEWTVSMGEGAEILAERSSISRDEQDEFAVGSHRRAAAAWKAGAFDDELAVLPGGELASDECVRADASMETLAKLKPVFRTDGSVTAGNSSPMNDGAAALLLMSEAGLARSGATPMARVVSRATSGIEPPLFGLGPVESSRVALGRAGLTWDDIDVVELNEAFAAQSLACLREMHGLDPTKVNPLGGAIAIGHPLGCSGARIITTLVHQLRRTGGRFGLATMCIGVGQGIAVVVESLS